MKFKPLLLALTLIPLLCAITVIESYQALAQHHCQQFPVELLWRVGTGRLSEKYGQAYFDLDCYVRQFVGADGAGVDAEDAQDEDEDEEQQEQQEELPHVDPIVAEYAGGLGCLPAGVDKQQAVYAIWRFFRFLLQNDYSFEWMRAKIRSGLGYEAERPNTWMDGENSAARLRLQKLFSNQFYEYVDQLMFKDFLYPLMTFFRENTVVALSGKSTQSGRPILVHSLSTYNHMETTFFPVAFNGIPERPGIFAYTVPGIPLLLSGSSQQVVWAFTGVLVDRTNIEEIETLGNKFYHHDSEQWLKLHQEQYQIQGVEGKVCKFLRSAYGPLYTKQDRDGKTSEYIVRWHEKEPKVRNMFTQMHRFLASPSIANEQTFSMQFPFNSLIFATGQGIFQYVCQQEYPSYFIYPDMFGEPEQIKNRLFTYPSKRVVVVSNSHLTPTNQQAYVKGDPLTPMDEQILEEFKDSRNTKHTVASALQLVKQTRVTAQQKKLKQILVRTYRKVKFYYLPQESHRKQCDQLLALLEKPHPLSQPIATLWRYFLHEFTFNYVSASPLGAHIVKHRLTTEHYWVNQMTLWEKGTSYGECDSDEYERMKHEVNGTGHNSSCYLNVVRALNRTRQVLLDRFGEGFAGAAGWERDSRFGGSERNFRADDAEEAFGTFYSRNVLFAAEVGNPSVQYHRGYLETPSEVDLSRLPVAGQAGMTQDEKTEQL